MTYVLGLVLRDKVARSGKENKSPITFLMDNPSELSSVIGPNRARLPREALLTAKGNVLDGDCRNTLVRKKRTQESNIVLTF